MKKFLTGLYVCISVILIGCSQEQKPYAVATKEIEQAITSAIQDYNHIAPKSYQMDRNSIDIYVYEDDNNYYVLINEYIDYQYGKYNHRLTADYDDRTIDGIATKRFSANEVPVYQELNKSKK